MANLGELLLERAWLTEAQLALTAERQSEFGGRFGTCLLELDLITEDLLLQCLSEQLAVPHASAADLEEIPEDLISLLPPAIAVKSRAVPFRAEGNRVHVAMLDTGDLALEDEISFAIGKRVRFHVAVELRIAQALSVYYGTTLPPRLVGLAKRLSENPSAAPPKAAPIPATEETDPDPDPDPDPSAPAVRHVIPQQARTVLESIPLTSEERAALADVRPTRQRLPPEETFTAKLEIAETSNDVGNALLEVLASELVRVLLYRVSGSRHEVHGWLAQGPDLDLDWFRDYSIGLQHASIFRHLESSREPFLGRLDQLPSHVALSRCWGGSLDHECLLLPVFVRDHLVCIVYGDRASLGVTGVDMELATRLAGKAAIAFERCILRHKLHSG